MYYIYSKKERKGPNWDLKLINHISLINDSYSCYGVDQWTPYDFF